ncbi:DUF3703 domain-containing protein [Noviherbaspirillum suwonense]|uniref:DUF3703 domain-containing protein n=1 Tax=Noviherbaspirillum suwonense TaxID=1224511 RepID=A0ABY1Q053_9BURK|nr:DUF3703 domain-containing protein [Noviherbaspirillum suwonense]SMP52160.1 Protein of unknown function [Noviherbaspirillum suwonense]
MAPLLKAAFEREMAKARRLYQEGRLDQAFSHLETAHVLVQRHVVPHVRSHWLMLKIGLRRRSVPEVFGQVVRIVLGGIGSAVGIVPVGNTGGTNISMFKRLPIAADIAHIADKR